LKEVPLAVDSIATIKRDPVGEDHMSEKFLRIFLDELETIRIVCRNENCGAVIELKTSNLGKLMNSINCPLCRTTIQGADNHFAALASALEGLKLMGDKACIQFVIPAKD
jgi:hypothetical protein